MSTCIEKLPCKDCGSSDSVQTYLNQDKDLGIDWYTSFCHGECWEGKGDPYTDGKAPQVEVKSEGQIREEIQTISSCKPFKPTQDFRGIPPSRYVAWGCRLLYSEFDGKTPYAIGFPYSNYTELSGWKCRPFLHKNFFAVGKTSNVDLFGWVRAKYLGGDTLWVTEGEFDAIALEYCMILAGKEKNYPVTSLSQGGGSIRKNLEFMEDRLGNYKHIALVLDDDKVGRIAEKTALEMFPDKIRIISKPKGNKDANDALKAGLAIEMGKLALEFKK